MHAQEWLTASRATISALLNSGVPFSARMVAPNGTPARAAGVGTEPGAACVRCRKTWVGLISQFVLVVMMTILTRMGGPRDNYHR